MRPPVRLRAARFAWAGVLALAATLAAGPGYAQAPGMPGTPGQAGQVSHVGQVGQGGQGGLGGQGGGLVGQGGQTGGNRALMEDWVRRKQHTRDQVYQELRRQGVVPKNGTVTFEATVLPDPKKPGKTRVRIDALAIREHPDTQASPGKNSVDPIFGPRSPGGAAESVNGVLPVGPQKTHDSITFIDGRPQPAQ